MLLHMMELNMPIDEVIHCDVGMEFPAMYEHIDKIKQIVENKGIKFTILKSDKSYEYLLMEYPYTSKGQTVKGYGWARGKSRWCTSLLKTEVIKKYTKQNFNNETIHYIGIAYDEQYRLDRKGNQAKNHCHPLVDWKWTEADALQYCYDNGFDFGGLYKIFDRVSCWCCPFMSYPELKKLYTNFPELWKTLKIWESKMDMSFRYNASIQMIEARFKLEEQREKDGLTNNPYTKDFREALNNTYAQFPSLEAQGFTRFSRKSS